MLFSLLYFLVRRLLGVGSRLKDDEATILINPDGTYADANSAALAILGVTGDELRALPAQALAVEQDREQADDLRGSWEAGGSDPLIGEGTVRRPDGKQVRLKFLIVPRKDGRFVAVLRPSSGTVGLPTSLFTIGQILSVWRAAERRLEAVETGSAEWAAIQTEIEAFREQYQWLFAAAENSPGEPPNSG